MVIKIMDFYSARPLKDLTPSATRPKRLTFDPMDRMDWWMSAEE